MSSSKSDLTVDQVRALRLRAQCLHPKYPPNDLTAAVQAVCGVQAQLSAAMMLALRARVHGLTPADVDAAIEQKRLVRTWLMRGTLHLLPAEDVRWMLAFLSPVFIPKGKGRRMQLGLTEDVSAKGLSAIRALLSWSALLTRGEIVERLAERGVVLDRRTQAPIHLIGLAALEGIVCLGPDAPNGESTYVLMDEWLEPSDVPSRDEALSLLLWRYLIGYAPASPQDFAAWSGLTLKDANRAWELLGDELINVQQVEDQALTMLAGETPPSIPASQPIVRLLPAFDTYILGYSDRDYVVAPEHQALVYHGGQTVPVVLVDGAAAGVWRYKRQGKRLQITVHPFDAFDQPVRDLVAEEANDVGRFWGAPVSLSYSTEPL